MNKILNAVFLSFVLLKSGNSFAEPNIWAEIIEDWKAQSWQAIDFHMHYAGNFLKYAKRKVKDNDDIYDQSNTLIFGKIYKQGILISDAFIPEYNSNGSIPNTHPFEKNRSAAAQVKQSDGKLFGLCGADLRANEYLQVVEECLTLPGMIGVKLHFAATDIFLSKALAGTDRYFERTANIAKILGRKGGIILIHFNRTTPQPADSTDTRTGNPEETTALLNLAFDYPKVKFVIAHSGLFQAIGLQGIKQIGDAFKDLKHLRNIYLDTAAALGYASWKQLGENRFDAEPTMWKENTDLTEAWKAFGLEYILYGSDEPNTAFLNELASITHHPDLTTKEKHNILYKNAERLLNEITKPQ